jgi:hypothetical protein
MGYWSRYRPKRSGDRHGDRSEAIYLAEIVG